MQRLFAVLACLGVLASGAVALADEPLDLRVYFGLEKVDRIKVDSKGRLRIPVECDEKFGCSGTVTIVTKNKLLIGDREQRLTILEDLFKVGSGNQVILVRLDATNRSFVRAARRLAVTMVVDVKDRTGNRAQVQLPGTLIAPHKHKSR